MHMEIDQAGADDMSRDIDAFGIRLRACGGGCSHGGDEAVLDEQIGGSVQAVGWIEDTTAG
jgi:hypothetical protein